MSFHYFYVPMAVYELAFPASYNELMIEIYICKASNSCTANPNLHLYELFIVNWNCIDINPCTAQCCIFMHQLWDLPIGTNNFFHNRDINENTVSLTLVLYTWICIRMYPCRICPSAPLNSSLIKEYTLLLPFCTSSFDLKQFICNNLFTALT